MRQNLSKPVLINRERRSQSVFKTNPSPQNKYDDTVYKNDPVRADKQQSRNASMIRIQNRDKLLFRSPAFKLEPEICLVDLEVNELKPLNLNAKIPHAL